MLCLVCSFLQRFNEICIILGLKHVQHAFYVNEKDVHNFNLWKSEQKN